MNQHKMSFLNAGVSRERQTGCIRRVRHCSTPIAARTSLVIPISPPFREHSSRFGEDSDVLKTISTSPSAAYARSCRLMMLLNSESFANASGLPPSESKICCERRDGPVR